MGNPFRVKWNPQLSFWNKAAGEVIESTPVILDGA